MQLTFYDIEFIIIYVFLVVIFLTSLRKKTDYSAMGDDIDLNMSKAIKGIACVMILTAHWGQRRFDPEMSWGISRVVWIFSANIALCWFIFFSGYGLTLKTYKTEELLVPIWAKRMKKVYLPLLITCVVCTIGYALLPSIYSIDESTDLWVSKDIYYLHHLSWNHICILLPHVLGWRDWYVLCIIVFYSLFYLSLWLNRKTNHCQTTWLFVLLCLYYIMAFWIFGRLEAHFYRYCWVFFISHVIAKWKTYDDKKRPLMMSIILCITLLMESKLMLLSFFIAIIIIVLVSIINELYAVKGKLILLLGSISYFFYLLHTRICYTLMVYMGANSIIVWVLLTAAFSWIINYLYNKLLYR